MLAGEALAGKPSSTSVSWREPVEASFGRAGSENGSTPGRAVQSSRPMSGSLRGSGPATPTSTFGHGDADCHAENGGQGGGTGVPESVMIVPMEDLVTSPEMGTRKVIRSRGRPRRPDEAAPFLSVDTLPVDTVVVDSKTQVPSTKCGGRPASGPSGGRRFTGSPKKYQSQVNLNNSMNSFIGGRKTPSQQKQGSRPSSKTSSLNYNSFFTHKNAVFLSASGPPSLWSVGNKFWPHQNSPPTGRRGPAFPPVMAVEGNTAKPNQLITQPFKHDVDAAPLTERCVSPSQELKEKTLQAVRDVAKDLSKKTTPTSPSRTGRLLKGKLKPLHTFKLQGPSIDQCKGVQAGQLDVIYGAIKQNESEVGDDIRETILHTKPSKDATKKERATEHAPTRYLEPTTYDPRILPPYIYASNLSEDRVNDLQSPMRVDDTVGDLGGNVAMVQMSAFIRMPPNSLASLGENGSDGMSPVPADAEALEESKGNKNEEDGKANQGTEEHGGNDEHTPAPAPHESTMSYYMNEGGAASILSDMVDRVKNSAQRVSEEVAQAVEGAFHDSMLVNSEPSFSWSETPANRSVVSDDGLFLESASQRSVRFSDHDSIIGDEPKAMPDVATGSDGQGSDVGRETPTQDVGVRNYSPTQSQTGPDDTTEGQGDTSIDLLQEQIGNRNESEEDASMKVEGDSQSESDQQALDDQKDTEKDQTESQTINLLQESQEEAKSLDQNENIYLKTNTESVDNSKVDVQDNETPVDANPKKDLGHKPDTNQSTDTEKAVDVGQKEQGHHDHQTSNTNQDQIRPESQTEQDAPADEMALPKVEEFPIQEEQQGSAIVVPENKQDQQNENTILSKPEESEEKLSGEQTAESAIVMGSEEAEFKMADSKQESQTEPVMPVVSVDVSEAPKVADQVALDLNKSENNAEPSQTDSNNADDHVNDKTGETDVEKTEEQKEKEEDSEERESCNKKDDEGNDKKDDGGDGSSGGNKGGGGESGHGGNNNDDSYTREDDYDRGGQDESGQSDSQHGDHGSNGNEESDAGIYSDQSNHTEPLKVTIVEKQTLKKNVFKQFDEIVSDRSVKKATKCWYGDLEDDVPEIEDSVLFCGICGLDEDACICPHSSLAPNRTQSGLARPTYNNMSDNEDKSIAHKKNRLRSAPGVMQGNQKSDSDDISSSENNIVMEYKALLGHEAGSGCFSSELTPRKERRASRSDVHFLLRGLPVAPGGDGREGGDSRKVKEDEGVGDSGCESEQMDGESLQNGDAKQGSEEMIERADPSTLKVVAEPKTLSRPKSGKNRPAPSAAPFPPLCFRINVRPPAGKLFYFAYGVDMNPKRMTTYLGSTVERRWGVLFGFKLRFNKRGSDVEAGGFPNIEFDPESSVEGCVYVITPAQLKTLDMFMGSPQFYTHAMFPVWMSNCFQPEQFSVAQYCAAALTYVALDKWTHPDTGKPLSCHYSIEQCLKGSDLLTTDYSQHMKAQLVA